MKMLLIENILTFSSFYCFDAAIHSHQFINKHKSSAQSFRIRHNMLNVLLLLFFFFSFLFDLSELLLFRIKSIPRQNFDSTRILSTRGEQQMKIECSTEKSQQKNSHRANTKHCLHTYDRQHGDTITNA